MSLTYVLDPVSIMLPPAVPGEAEAALHGLSAKQKYLPSWLFYDAEGSRLFEAITRLPEYYLTSKESSIFSQHAEEMIEAAAGPAVISNHPSLAVPSWATPRLSVVELGAGSASKTIILLRALARRQASTLYLPVDVSESALESASRNVRAALPGVQVQPLCSEITQEGQLDLPQQGRRLALYIGSSIGNFDPEEAIDLLRWLRLQLQPADALLLGTDMVKDPQTMLAAYNDRAGITAAFNRNILRRLNRELGANFDLAAFEHRAIWNPVESRMEMHLDSRVNQTVYIPAIDRSFGFRQGESIHTENSYKFTPQGIDEILLRSGFSLETSWYDPDRWFGVHLARVLDQDAISEENEEKAAA